MSDQEKISENEEVNKQNHEQTKETAQEKEITSEKASQPKEEKEAEETPEANTQEKEITPEEENKETEKEAPEVNLQEKETTPEKASQPEEEEKEKKEEQQPEAEKEKTASEPSEGSSETSEQQEDDADEEEVSSSDDSDDKEDEDDEEKVNSKDYHSMNQQQLIAALKDLLNTGKIQEIKKEVDEIRNEFNNQFDEESNEKKEEFLAQGGNIIDFHYATPLKNEFNSLHFEYREKRNNYYKTLKKDLQSNLEKRLALIEELKGLIDVEENINTTYKHFKDIQDRWKEAGPIPRDGYNTVWNNYHHHVENFYDFLHLNREFRDMDFKHNLEQKLKIINRAEELAAEENINKAFRELQMLHKMWKEDTGPVAKEYRDDVWDRFSAATKSFTTSVQHFKRKWKRILKKIWRKKMKSSSKSTP
jgi:hypothetical protein